MLTSSLHKLQFEDNENSISRNSNCSYGGNGLNIKIKKHKNMSTQVTGVKLSIIPYIPNQIFDRAQYFDKIEILEDFNNDEINISLDIMPEYSYLISGAYNSHIGSLSSSRNYSLPGEIERMLQKVGCFIKNDFFYENDTAEVTIDKSSSIECAESCSKSFSQCNFGWSYQLSTKKCMFMRNVSTENFKPSMNSTRNDCTIGWISGLKSCAAPGIRKCYNRLFNIFCFRFEWGLE